MFKAAIERFVALLNSEWAAIDAMARDAGRPELLGDWAQASWEALVEGALSSELPGIRLVVYGDGADVHPKSSRFSFENDSATHEVRCVPIAANGATDRLSNDVLVRDDAGYALDRFVAVGGKWYAERPTFDHALVTRDGVEYVVPLAEIKWRVVPVVG